MINFLLWNQLVDQQLINLYNSEIHTFNLLFNCWSTFFNFLSPNFNILFNSWSPWTQKSTFWSTVDQQVEPVKLINCWLTTAKKWIIMLNNCYSTWSSSSCKNQQVDQLLINPRKFSISQSKLIRRSIFSGSTSWTTVDQQVEFWVIINSIATNFVRIHCESPSSPL